MGVVGPAIVILVITKTCVTAVVVAAAVTIGLAARSGTAIAHDCDERSHASSYGSDYHHDDKDCPTFLPAPIIVQRPAHAPTPTPTTDVATLMPPPSTPNGIAAIPAPQAPVVRHSEAAGVAAVEGARIAAASDNSGVSWLALALGALAVVALLALIRAGFLARRQLGDGVDGRWSA